METITFDHDIPVMYLTASSFPEGIMEAHEKLHKIVPYSVDRKYFGISRPENGPIVYRAAAEEKFPGEAEKLGLDKLILKKGEYASITVNDYPKYLHTISDVFQKLLALPNIDPEGYCVEWYIPDTDVKCMVRLK